MRLLAVIFALLAAALGAADRQLVVFSGRPDGSIELVDRRQQPEVHTLLREPGNRALIIHNVGTIDADPAQWEDALKVSGCDALTVLADAVHGGNEDVVDVHFSRDCTVIIGDAHPRGKYVATIKGKSERVALIVERQHGHGRETDYDFGNFSDTHNERTTGCSLSARVVDGSAAKVRLLEAGKVTYPVAGQRFDTERLNQGFFYAVFNFFKDLLRSLGAKV